MGTGRRLPGKLGEAGVTRREADVLTSLTERLSNAEIARRLYLSERTVESHVSSLLRKLGARNRADLAALAGSLAVAPAELPRTMRASPTTDQAGAFVGRGEELSLAARVLADPTRNRAAALWIVGEPGIGKTRLAVEIAGRAHAGGALVLFGRCNEDLGVPYQPFLEALQWFVAHLSEGDVAARLGDAPGELTRLVPQLSERLSGQQPRRSPNPEIEQYRLFEAVRSWLAAAGRLVVLVIDDVHWATPPTLQLLAHVAGSAEASGVVLVCTARSTMPDHNEAVAALVGELERRGAASHRLDLRGLQVHAVGELVESVLHRRLDEPLRALTVALHQGTAGNPLFVRSLLANLTDQPRDLSAGGEWSTGDMPDNVADIVRRRLRRLPEVLSETLRTAAVVGLEFDLRLVARAVGGEELDTLTLLELADRAGLVEEVGANRYRFVHALIRAALRDELSESRRVRLHRRIGEAIEALYGDRAEEQASALAHHFGEAMALGEAARAHRYSLLAARRAEAVLSHEEAAAAYGRALDLLDHLRDVGPETRGELLLARGEALGRAGESRAALAVLRAAADEAHARGQFHHEARAALAHERASFRLGFFGAEAVALLRRAEAGLPPGETPLRARTLAATGRALELSGRRVEAIGLGEEALAMAGRLGDPATTVHALWCALFSYMDVEQAALMADRCARLGTMAREVNDDEVRAWSLSTGIIASAALGELASVDGMLEDFSDAVTQLRQPWLEVVLGYILHVRAFLAGDLTEAQRTLDQAHRGDRARGWGSDALYGLGVFLIRREQGRLESVAPALRALVAAGPPEGLWGPGLAALYAELELVDEARVELDRLAADEFASVPFDATRQVCLGLLAEVASAVGDAERAAWLFERLRPLEGRLLVFQGCIPPLGPVDRLLGMLASTAGRPTEAEQLLGRAVEQCRALPAPVWLAHSLYQYATRASDPAGAAARSMLVEVGRLCRRHGLSALARRATLALGQAAGSRGDDRSQGGGSPPSVD